VTVQAVADPLYIEGRAAVTVDELLALAISVMALVVGVLIAWRQHHPGPLRVLALVCLAGVMITTHSQWPARYYHDHFAGPVEVAMYWVVFTGFAHFCLTFPPASSVWRARWARVAFGVYATGYVAYTLVLALRSFGMFPAVHLELLDALWLPWLLAGLSLAALDMLRLLDEYNQRRAAQGGARCALASAWPPVT
jgi:hypothetical protein